jgi:hypothetical protein
LHARQSLQPPLQGANVAEDLRPSARSTDPGEPLNRFAHSNQRARSSLVRPASRLARRRTTVGSQHETCSADGATHRSVLARKADNCAGQSLQARQTGRSTGQSLHARQTSVHRPHQGANVAEDMCPSARSADPGPVPQTWRGSRSSRSLCKALADRLPYWHKAVDLNYSTACTMHLAGP